LAEGIRNAYSDLFAVSTKANELSKSDLIGKFKTLSQGQYSDAVLGHMSDTFLTLVKLADFKATKKPAAKAKLAPGAPVDIPPEGETRQGDGLHFGGLVYNIQIVLPDTRDQAVYDALFKSLRQHLGGVTLSGPERNPWPGRARVL